ncbi:MAG TPA: aldehyde dehydrogenase family protein [Methylocella sp.]|nr:aldehyde dehydrogenase family protein [Methylocella sp.]
MSAVDSSTAPSRTATASLLRQFGVLEPAFTHGDLIVRSPLNGAEIARVSTTSRGDAADIISKAQSAFLAWRIMPAPRRGELVRRFGEALRQHKPALGHLISIETGKILQEGLGEVQEMIDICDFAAGLSRQLYGLTIATERPGHKMLETWHPLGVAGVITAFNFPAAVWSWNAAIALVCGDTLVWKPSEKTPLTALACQSLLDQVAASLNETPAGLSAVLIGGSELGEELAGNHLVALVSATGSTRMGRAVASKIASRFGRAILELSGNNGMIITPSADLDLAIRATLFAAVGTAGQRCTTLRRLFVHEDVYDDLLPRLKQAYGDITVGNPLEAGTLAGPLIDKQSFEAMQASLAQAREDGGMITGGERVHAGLWPDAYYVRPAIAEMMRQTEVVRRETFAPILYVMRYREFEEGISQLNGVPQGLASSIFTHDLREAERFMSSTGSDCGIVNVNMGPTGAEIGGAFGGEKDTGGGREAGSDAWKSYMRRATNTINYSDELPLAQGIRFDVPGAS